MKVCNKCRKNLPPFEFHRDKDKKDGLRTVCKSCRSNYSKKYYLNNKDTINKRCNDYYANNAEFLRGKASINGVIWRKLNPHKVTSKNARRRASKKLATPNWLTEDHKAEIEKFYILARDCQTITGEPYHVDHIVPLKGKDVCGLHVPWNLQVLPADVNLSKSNTFS